MPNENCLEGLQCPCCGNEDVFHIEAQCTCEVRDDGIYDHRNEVWDGNSACGCGACNNAGTVWSFTVGSPEWKRKYLAAVKAGDREEDPSLTRETANPKWKRKWGQ